jgi:hypothetical protein
MSGRVAGTALAALALMGVMSGDQASAQRGGGDKWERLGCVEVGRRVETDIIQIGRREGRYKAVRLQVENRDININSLKVIYGDGQPDMLAVNATLRVGSPSRPLDLEGWARSIERIELVATKDRREGRGRAEVCIEGLQASRDEIARFRDGGDRGRDGRGRDGDGDRGRDGRGRPGPAFVERGNWQQLGCERAGFLGERDVIQVGRKEGRFRALRVSATSNSVAINDLKVIFSNGEYERLMVQQDVREGTTTQPIDLPGDRRSIDRIEMAYQSKPNFKGQARVCVEGLE